MPYEKCDLDSICRMNILGMIPWGLSRAIPVFVFLIFGDKIVEPVNDYVQNAQWLTDAFKAAAGLLPAIGFAILLRYVNTKKYFAYLLIGFVLSAYLGIPMLGIAILGLAAALIVYKQQIERVAVSTLSGGDNEDE